MKVGDVVRISCQHSKYDGIVGTIFEIQKASRYAIVDMPKGTERRIENIRENRILARMKPSPKKKRPKGDPQWFPLRWLEPTPLHHEADQLI